MLNVYNDTKVRLKHNHFASNRLNYSYCISVLPSIPKGLYPFSAGLSLKWDWDGAKTFDVDTSPTQNMPFPYAFNFGWGEH